MNNLDPQLHRGRNDINQNNTCAIQRDVEKCVKMEPEDLSDVEVVQESTSDKESGILQDDIIVLEESNQNSDTEHDSAPRKIKVESLNVDQNEQIGIITAIKIEPCDDQQLPLDQNDILQNNTCVVQSDVKKCGKMQPELLSDVEVVQENTKDVGNRTLQDDIIVLEESNHNSDTHDGSAPRKIKVESSNVNQSEQTGIKTTIKIETCDDQQLPLDQNDILQNNTCVVQSDVEKCGIMQPAQSDVEEAQENTTDVGNRTLQDDIIVLEESNHNSDTHDGSAPRKIKVESLNVNQSEQTGIKTTIKIEPCDNQQLPLGENDILQNNTCVVQSDIEKCVKMEPEDLSDVEIVQENTTDKGNGTLQDDIIILEESNQKSDIDHGSAPRKIKDESLNVNQSEQTGIKTTIKIEPCDELGVECGDVIQCSDTQRPTTEDTLQIRQPSQDIPLKIVKIILHRCDNLIATANRTLPPNAAALMANQQQSATDGTTHTITNVDNTPKENTTNKKRKESRASKRENPEDISRKRKKNDDRRNHAEKTSSVKVPFSKLRQKQLPQRDDVAKVKLKRKPNAISNSNTDERFECALCQKCFSLKSRLISHIRRHSREKPYECDVCNKRFTCKSDLAIHTSTHTDEKPFECDVCNKLFSCKSYLARHARTHTDVKPFKCDVCQKCFKWNFNLLNHAITHTVGKKFECDVCYKRFSWKGDLAKHTRTHISPHTDGKPFECGLCKKIFSAKKSLTRHARTHTDEKPFKCDVCQKCFKWKFNLDKHAHTHTGEKHFECDTCKRCFGSKGELVNHALLHTDKKPFECKVCKKRFRRKTHLNDHARTHTGEKPYECDVCKKSFSIRTELTKHHRIHSGIKPFKCDVCNKCFRVTNNLAAHLRTHTIEKPYTCNVCQKRFSDKSALDRHSRRQHK